MNKFRVFFCYRSTEQERARELQESLAHLSPNLPFEDASRDVPQAEDWKPHATAALESSAAAVCFVGEDTHLSEPIDWEIREAHRLGKPVVVILLSEGCRQPAACKELKVDVARWNANDVAGRIGEMLVSRALFLSHDWGKGTPTPDAICEQYKLMVQSWESLIARRQTVITMYLSATSALLAAIGVLISSLDKLGQWWTLGGIAVLAFLGAALSFNWSRTVASYGILSKAKGKVVEVLEGYMPARLFDTEWKVLEAHRYTSTTKTDGQTALFFLLLFLSVLFVCAGVAAGQLGRGG